MRLPLLCMAACLTAAALPSRAARPFITDDARLTTAGSCQLESWYRRTDAGHEFWALPACNPTGNVEFTFGGGEARSPGMAPTHDHVLQIKTLGRALETNGWGWGLAVGRIRHPSANPGPNLLGNTYAYVPMSWSLREDQVVIHTNVGWLHDTARRRHSATWGVGAEWNAHPRITGIAEVFGDSRAHPFMQVGVRWTLVPNLLQIDTSAGQQLNGAGDGRWISLGLRFTPARLF